MNPVKHAQSSPSTRKENSNLGKTYNVKCRGLRCLAYRDRDNKWRMFYGDKLIDGEVEILNQF
jgi:hypothetical protein